MTKFIDIKYKDELIEKWKSKCESFEIQLKEYKLETDQKIFDLELAMEKAVNDKISIEESKALLQEESSKTVANLKQDLKHYCDLYKTCESNCTTICKAKLQTVQGKPHYYLFRKSRFAGHLHQQGPASYQKAE